MQKIKYDTGWIDPLSSWNWRSCLLLGTIKDLNLPFTEPGGL